jgi:hypothetical protein
MKLSFGELLAPALGVASILSPDAKAAQPNVEWIKQFGTSAFDGANGVAADALGDVYIAGSTTGSLAAPNQGSQDCFLQKYSPSGTVEWSRQFGTSTYDEINQLATASAGSVYFAGETGGSLAGPSLGSGEAIVGKYSANGTLQWMHQIGTPGAEAGTGVAVDHLGNVYLCGSTSGPLAAPLNGDSDAFVTKFDPSGSLLWTRQWGISLTEEGNDVAVDSIGNVYVAGWTSNPYTDVFEAFLTKYDTNDNVQWTRLSGTHTGSASYGVSVDNSGNIYQSGYTGRNVGGPNAGGIFSSSFDAFVIKYDPSGAVLWKQQWGNTFSEVTRGIATDTLGGVCISGSTNGGTSAEYGRDDDDPFLSKLDSVGNLV